MIKYNTWYLITDDFARDKFIKELQNEVSHEVIGELPARALDTADCFYISADPLKIRYRTTYNKLYMGKVETYQPELNDKN